MKRDVLVKHHQSEIRVLEKERSRLERELSLLQLKLTSGKLKNTSSKKTLRHDLARINTIIKAKSLVKSANINTKS